MIISLNPRRLRASGNLVAETRVAIAAIFVPFATLPALARRGIFAGGLDVIALSQNLSPTSRREQFPVASVLGVSHPAYVIGRRFRRRGRFVDNGHDVIASVRGAQQLLALGFNSLHCFCCRFLGHLWASSLRRFMVQRFHSPTVTQLSEFRNTVLPLYFFGVDKGDKCRLLRAIYVD